MLSSTLGLSGSSTRSLANQAGFGAGRSASLLEADAAARERQTGRDLTGAQNTYIANLSRVQKPNGLGLALQIGGSTLSAVGGYNTSTGNWRTPT